MYPVDIQSVIIFDQQIENIFGETKTSCESL